MGTRRKSRELTLQMLFQADMGKQTPEQVRQTFWRERADVEADVRSFAEDLFRVAGDRATEIDGLIESTANLGSLPALFVAAKQDVLVSVERVERLALSASNSTVHVIESSHLEAPDKSRPAIFSWLTRL